MVIGFTLHSWLFYRASSFNSGGDNEEIKWIKLIPVEGSTQGPLTEYCLPS